MRSATYLEPFTLGRSDAPSESDDTVARSVESVEHHGRWLDLMGVPRSPRYAINVHIGAITVTRRRQPTGSAMSSATLHHGLATG